jgi:tetrahydromethanopterin S-methyltransferase subunit B
MTKDRVAKALRAAAEALDPKGPKKGKPVKAASGGQVFIGLVIAPAVGAWIEPSSDVDELQEQVDAVLAKAKKLEPDAEEWMVSDYDDFPNLGEYPGVEALAKVAGALEDHDAEIVQAAFEEAHDVDDAIKMLDDGYAVYDSEESYGEQLVDDIGLDSIKNKEWYVDMDALSRDIMMDVDVYYVNGAPFVFNK